MGPTLRAFLAIIARDDCAKARSNVVGHTGTGSDTEIDETSCLPKTRATQPRSLNGKVTTTASSARRGVDRVPRDRSDDEVGRDERIKDGCVHHQLPWDATSQSADSNRMLDESEEAFTSDTDADAESLGLSFPSRSTSPTSLENDSSPAVTYRSPPKRPNPFTLSKAGGQDKIVDLWLLSRHPVQGPNKPTPLVDSPITTPLPAGTHRPFTLHHVLVAVRILSQTTAPFLRLLLSISPMYTVLHVIFTLLRGVIPAARGFSHAWILDELGGLLSTFLRGELSQSAMLRALQFDGRLVILAATEGARILCEGVFDALASHVETKLLSSLRFSLEARSLSHRLQLDMPTLQHPETMALLAESELFVRSFMGGGGAFGVLSPLDLVRVLAGLGEVVVQAWVLLRILGGVGAVRLGFGSMWGHIFGFDGEGGREGEGEDARGVWLVVSAAILPGAISCLAGWIPIILSTIFTYITFAVSRLLPSPRRLYTSPVRANSSIHRHDAAQIRTRRTRQRPTPSDLASLHAQALERQERMRLLAYGETYRAEVVLFGLGPWVLRGWARARRRVLGLESVPSEDTFDFIEGSADFGADGGLLRRLRRLSNSAGWLMSILRETDFGLSEVGMLLQHLPLLLMSSLYGFGYRPTYGALSPNSTFLRPRNDSTPWTVGGAYGQGAPSTALGTLALTRGAIHALLFACREVARTLRLAYQGVFLMGAFFAAGELRGVLSPVAGERVAYPDGCGEKNEAVLAATDIQVTQTSQCAEQQSQKGGNGGMKIECRDLCFTYPGNAEPTLRNVSLTVEAGETVAIVGYNGSGKSTLAHLLLRILDFDSGELLVNGVDIRKLEPGEYHQHVGALMQQYARLRGTVRENVGVGDVSRMREEDGMGCQDGSACGDGWAVPELGLSFEKEAGTDEDEGWLRELWAGDRIWDTWRGREKQKRDKHPRNRDTDKVPGAQQELCSNEDLADPNHNPDAPVLAAAHDADAHELISALPSGLDTRLESIGTGFGARFAGGEFEHGGGIGGYGTGAMYGTSAFGLRGRRRRVTGPGQGFGIGTSGIELNPHARYGLSGGEWQRLAISRAFLRAQRADVDLLLLDEPTAHLDAFAQRRVLEGVERLKRGLRPGTSEQVDSPPEDSDGSRRTKTVIIITHQLSIAKRADKIAMFEGGTITEFGTHEELLAKPNGHYAQLFHATC